MAAFQGISAFLETGASRNGYMSPKLKQAFDPEVFLAKVGEGRTIADYSKNQVVFSQATRLTPFFTSKKARSSSRSSPTTAEKRSSPFWTPATSLARRAWRAGYCA